MFRNSSKNITQNLHYNCTIWRQLMTPSFDADVSRNECLWRKSAINSGSSKKTEPRSYFLHNYRAKYGGRGYSSLIYCIWFPWTPLTCIGSEKNQLFNFYWADYGFNCFDIFWVQFLNTFWGWLGRDWLKRCGVQFLSVIILNLRRFRSKVNREI